MLPDEMWEEVLIHVEVLDLLRLKRVSKDWNRIITGVIKRTCKWYKKCVAEIPEDMWSSLLNHQTHPEIRCENFHEAQIHSEIWMTMYRSWIGWNTLPRKSTSIEEVFSKVDFSTFCAVTGSIVAINNARGQILFYDISESSVNLIYLVNHGAPIGDVVLCRSGSDVMAVACAMNDILYWDLQTKKQIHQTECRHSGRILKANFDYCYSLSCDAENIWILNVEQFVSGTVRSVRSIIFTDENYIFKAMGTDADQAILFMTSEGSHKFCINLPDNTFETLSFHENVYGEVKNMFHAHKWYFKIDKPCVTTYIHRLGTLFALSVDAKPWKTYEIESDICVGGYVSAILYHVTYLMIAIKFGYIRDAEVHLYSIMNVNDLDNLDFKSMSSKKLKFTSSSIKDLAVTEYNSCQYLLAVAYKRVYIVKFE